MDSAEDLILRLGKDISILDYFKPENNQTYIENMKKGENFGNKNFRDNYSRYKELYEKLFFFKYYFNTKTTPTNNDDGE